MLPPGWVKWFPWLEYVAGRCKNLEYVLIVQETGPRKKLSQAPERLIEFGAHGRRIRLLPLLSERLRVFRKLGLPFHAKLRHGAPIVPSSAELTCGTSVADLRP